MTWALVLQFVLKYKRWLLYAGIALLVLFSLRWYGNREWEKGVSYGDTRTSVKLTKEYEARWATEQKKLDTARRLLDEQVKTNETNRRVLEARASELARARSVLQLAVKLALERAQASVKTGYQSAATVSDAELAGAIRAVSSQLERERQAPSPPE